MRLFLIVVFAVASAAFVLTDPRWSGGLTDAADRRDVAGDDGGSRLGPGPPH